MVKRLNLLLITSVMISGIFPACSSCGDSLTDELDQQRALAEKETAPDPLMDKADDYLRLVGNYKIYELGIDAPRKKFFGNAKVDLRVFFALGLQVVPVGGSLAVIKLVLIAPKIDNLSKDSKPQEVRELLFGSSGIPALNLDILDVEYESEKDEALISNIGSFAVYEVLSPILGAANTYSGQQKQEYERALMIFRELVNESQDTKLKPTAMAWIKDQFGSLVSSPPVKSPKIAPGFKKKGKGKPQGKRKTIPLPKTPTKKKAISKLSPAAKPTLFPAIGLTPTGGKLKRKAIPRPAWWGKRALPKTPTKKKGVYKSPPSAGSAPTGVVGKNPPSPPPLPPSGSAKSLSVMPKSSSSSAGAGGGLLSSISAGKSNLKKVDSSKTTPKPTSSQEKTMAAIRSGDLRKKLKKVDTSSLRDTSAIAKSADFKLKESLKLNHQGDRQRYLEELKKFVKQQKNLESKKQDNFYSYPLGKEKNKSVEFRIYVQEYAKKDEFHLFYLGPKVKDNSKLLENLFRKEEPSLEKEDLEYASQIYSFVAQPFFQCLVVTKRKRTTQELWADKFCAELLAKFHPEKVSAKSALERTIMNRREDIDFDSDSEEEDDWEDDD